MVLAWGISNGAVAQTASGLDWSGGYVGGLLGVTDSKSEVSSVAGRLQYFDATDAAQIARVGKNKLDQLGVSGGLVLGYGKQYGNVLVGIEASATSLSLDKEHVARQEMDANPGSQSTIRQSVSADWMAGLRLRLGWAERNWLTYVTAGIAATRLKLNSTYTDNAFTGFSHGSKSTSVTGTSLGFGGEYALDQKWSFRGEYLYTKFDRISTMSDVTSTNNSGGTMIHKADLDNHALYVGLTYRF
ncbi:porin family protein [Denitratisoma sp. agr-D3]